MKIIAIVLSFFSIISLLVGLPILLVIPSIGIFMIIGSIIFAIFAGKARKTWRKEKRTAIIV